MKTIRHLLFATIPLVAFAGLALADPSPKAVGTATAPGKNIIDDAATRQAQLKRSFEAFRNRLSLLASRMEQGSDLDKTRAKSLRKALKFMSEQGTEGRFDVLIGRLTKKDTSHNLDSLSDVLKENKELRQDLQQLIKILLEDDSAKLRARKIEDLAKLLDRLKELRGQQARLQAQTERGKADAKELAKVQDKIREQTGDIVKPARDDESEKDAKARESIRKPIGKAVNAQGKASKDLQGNKSEDAGESQGEAVDQLDNAIRIIEDQINQERQEERQERLADLLSRAKRMLAMQVEVRDGLELLDRDIRKAGKPTVAHSARSNKLADQESRIQDEARSALKLIKAEASAVAFAEVFEGLMDDIRTLQDRLARTETGRVSQNVAEDVVDTLKEIIAALTKAINEQPPPNTPRPPTPPGPRPPPRLVTILQQLKMVMGMQKRIHDRTALYGKRIKGEQLGEVSTSATALEKRQHAAIKRELQSLSDRQKRLREVTREVSKLSEQQETRID